MKIEYEDFNLYYSHTYIRLKDEGIVFIQGATEPESSASYKIAYEKIDGTGRGKRIAASTFFKNMEPFVPTYGFFNFDGFAVHSCLGSYRQAKRAFSTERVEFTVPNMKELNMYMGLKGKYMDSWLYNYGAVLALADPKFESLKAAMEKVLSAKALGVAISPAFAVLAELTNEKPLIYYKSQEIGQWDDNKGCVEFNEKGKPFVSLFEEHTRSVKRA